MAVPSRRRGIVAGLGLASFVGGGVTAWSVEVGRSDARRAETPSPASAPVSASVAGTSIVAAPGSSSTPSSTSAITTTIDPDAPPAEQTGAGNPVTFVFGGDVHFDGPLAAALANRPAAVFAGLQPALGDADVAVVNLETAIGSGGRKAPKAFNFQAAPAAFDALTDAGVDVISMANNHALDYGQDGLLQTFAAAAAVDAPIIGVGGNEMAALAPWTATVNGQRIAVIAATSVLDGNLIRDWTATEDHPGVASAKRVDQLLAAVAQARAAADTVVVFLHWGTEATFCPNRNQQDLAPRLVGAGADIVVGSHAHRVLAGGHLGHAYVHYGLGNLVFKAGGTDSRDTGLLRVTATGRRIDAAEWIPGRIGADHTPTLLDGADRDRELAAWNSRRACSDLAEAPS